MRTNPEIIIIIINAKPVEIKKGNYYVFEIIELSIKSIIHPSIKLLYESNTHVYKNKIILN
jgi:hypothetical protein